MHDHALPKSATSENSSKVVQTTLVGFAMPKWTKDGLLEHIAALIVSEDEVCFLYKSSIYSHLYTGSSIG